MSLKRLKKEIENYHEKKYYLKYKYPISKFLDNFTVFYDDEMNNNIPFNNTKTKIIIKNKDNNNDIFITIPTDYPFKPPSVDWFPILSSGTNFYQNTSYHRFMNSLNSNKNIDFKILAFFYNCQFNTKSKFLNLNRLDCFCCNSKTCYNNWSPGLTITDIIIEVMEMNYINTYSKKNMYKYLSNIYNKLFEKLNDDVIYNILSFIS